MTSAMMMPITTSSTTVATVKMTVVCTAGQNSWPSVPLGHLLPQFSQYR